MTAPIPQPPLTIFASHMSAARTASDAWQALHRLADRLIGCKLFTVMTVDMTAGLARRAFSGDPAHYPVSGTKPITANRWFDVVHGERRSFLANTLAEIATVFPDHELIGSLGLGSVLNLPVVLSGELAATINMLAAEGYFTPERVALAESSLPIPAMLSCAVARQFDRQPQKPD
jgi:hypothetical protein